MYQLLFEIKVKIKIQTEKKKKINIKLDIVGEGSCILFSINTNNKMIYLFSYFFLMSSGKKNINKYKKILVRNLKRVYAQCIYIARKKNKQWHYSACGWQCSSVAFSKNLECV